MPLAAQGFGSEHTRGIGALLTGRPILEGTFDNAGTPNAGWASGISIDQHIAKELMPPTAFRSLELGVQVVDAEVRGRISSFLTMSFSFPMLGSLPVSALARSYGAPTAVGAASLTAIALSIVFYLSSPSLRGLDDAVRGALENDS